MSLVSEALRKARRHADAAGSGPGGALPPTLVLPHRRLRAGLSFGALLGVAAVAGLAGAAGVWLLVGRQHREPAAGRVAAAPTAAAPLPGAAVPTQAPPVAGAARPASNASFGAAPSEPAPAAAIPSGPAPAAAAWPAQEAEPAAPAPVAIPRDGSYLIDADLGYVKLHLDYLVYRPGSPFGRVNGQDVVTGTTVSGFVVEEITVDHIKLADKRHTVTLRVR